MQPIRVKKKPINKITELIELSRDIQFTAYLIRLELDIKKRKENKWEILG